MRKLAAVLLCLALSTSALAQSCENGVCRTRPVRTVAKTVVQPVHVIGQRLVQPEQVCHRPHYKRCQPVRNVLRFLFK